FWPTSTPCRAKPQSPASCYAATAVCYPSDGHAGRTIRFRALRGRASPAWAPPAGNPTMKSDQTIHLISNGDFRDAACVTCWPMQDATIREVQRAFKKLGFKTQIDTPYHPARKHGFITK